MNKNRVALRLLCLLCCLLCLPALAEDAPAEKTTRDALIDSIIETGRQLYVKANGKLQRAQYASDIYVCKNFTVHVFRENCAGFRMAEYPGVPLKIPNNLPAKECKPHA